jgi:flagellar P-ring protein precursor FlgI
MYLKRNKIFFTILFINFSLIAQQEDIKNINFKEGQVQIVDKNYPYKLKDVVRILGYKNNQLIGYGIVVGLNGTGDSKFKLNKQILSKLLNKFNINVDLDNYETKNIASVLVTAEIPPFSKKGDRITCNVSSIGDAKSIQEGVLIQTPLYGANGKIYAVAQGKILNFKKENKFFTSNNGYIPQGAIIEKDLDELEFENKIKLQLIDFDLEQLNIIYNTLKQKNFDAFIEGGSIVLQFNNKIEAINQITEILNLEISLPLKNKIVFNQEAKTLLITGNINIKPFIVGRLWKPEQYSKIQREAYQGIYIYTPSLSENKNLIYFNVHSLEELMNEFQKYTFTIEEIITIFESLIESGLIKADLIIR